jgi:putative transposase
MAARYVALNPVRARLVAQAQDWVWSSTRAHLAGRDDGLVRVAPLLDRVGDFANLIDVDGCDIGFAALRDAEGTGRPLGSDDFVAILERVSGRPFRKRKPDRKTSGRAEQFELGLAAMRKVSP